jgi:inosine/xanthosine triphosphatase
MDSHEIFHIAIGSENPAKIQAVKLGFKKLFPDTNCLFFPVQVDSGVSVQPFGFQSTIQGAITRAKNAYKSKFKSKSDGIRHFGVGIEAGMIPVPLTKSGYLDYQFCVVYQSNESISIGSGPGFEYPAKIVKILREDPSHHEIGTIIAELSGIKDIKKQEGAIGFLSKNTFIRAEILKFSVITALLPIMNPDLYLT